MRRIVRRVKPTPGSQLALFATYGYHAFITDREGVTLELEADHRRHTEIEDAIRDLKYGIGLNHLPSGCFAANAAWLAGHTMAHNLPVGRRGAAWPGRADSHHQDPPAAVRFPGRTAHPLGTPVDPASSRSLALGGEVQPRLGPAASHSTPGLTAPLYHTDPPANPTPPQKTHVSPVRERLLPCPYPAISLATATVGRHRCPPNRLQTARQPPVYPNSSPDHRA